MSVITSEKAIRKLFINLNQKHQYIDLSFSSTNIFLHWNTDFYFALTEMTNSLNFLSNKFNKFSVINSLLNFFIQSLSGIIYPIFFCSQTELSSLCSTKFF